MLEQATVFEERAAGHRGNPTVDAAVLDGLASDLGDTGGELRAEIVQLYLDEGAPHIQALIAAAARGDATTVRRVSHTLRSTSATLGAAGLAALLQRVEDASRPPLPGSPADIEMLCQAIAAEYRLVAADLARYAVTTPVAA